MIRIGDFIFKEADVKYIGIYDPEDAHMMNSVRVTTTHGCVVVFTGDYDTCTTCLDNVDI